MPNKPVIVIVDDMLQEKLFQQDVKNTITNVARAMKRKPEEMLAHTELFSDPGKALDYISSAKASGQDIVLAMVDNSMSKTINGPEIVRGLRDHGFANTPVFWISSNQCSHKLMQQFPVIVSPPEAKNAFERLSGKRSDEWIRSLAKAQVEINAPAEEQADNAMVQQLEKAFATIERSRMARATPGRREMMSREGGIRP